MKLLISILFAAAAWGQQSTFPPSGGGGIQGLSSNGTTITATLPVAIGTTLSVNGCVQTSGTGSPNAAVTGSPCDTFRRSDGGAGTVLYVKETGSATNTGWVAYGGPSLTSSVDTTTPVTVSTTSGFNVCDRAGCTYTLPTITAAMVTAVFQRCFRNAVTRTGAITLTAPASTYIDVAGANGTAAGTLVSAGALGDSVCVVAITTTQYAAYVQNGAWTNN